MDNSRKTNRGGKHASGRSARVDKVVVDWPYRSSRETLADLAPNQFLQITEGRGVTARSPVGLRE